MNSFRLKDGKLIEFKNTKVMGIINATSESFYANSRVSSIDEALNIAKKMINDGAEILDIGGESTRPGADPISVEDEIKRVLPIIKNIKKNFPDTLISLDTYHSETAKIGIENGVDIINDISGLTFDKDMVKIIKEYNVPFIIMHIKGTPKNMQKNPEYSNVIIEMIEFFDKQINLAKSYEIEDDKIILDPGIGFGKNYEHNIEIIKKIDFMKLFNYPILLAVSRKTFIGKILKDAPPEERLNGTIAISCYAASKNIEMVRVHDVKENYEAIKIIEALK